MLSSLIALHFIISFNVARYEGVLPKPQPEKRLENLVEENHPQKDDFKAGDDEAKKKAKEAAEKAGMVIFGIGLGAFILYCIVTLAVQMIPWFVALARGHNSSLSIFVLSFFLGWTCIGWVVALVWACSGDTRSIDRRRARHYEDDDYDDRPRRRRR